MCRIQPLTIRNNIASAASVVRVSLWEAKILSKSIRVLPNLLNRTLHFFFKFQVRGFTLEDFSSSSYVLMATKRGFVTAVRSLNKWKTLFVSLEASNDHLFFLWVDRKAREEVSALRKTAGFHRTQDETRCMPPQENGIFALLLPFGLAQGTTCSRPLSFVAGRVCRTGLDFQATTKN